MPGYFQFGLPARLNRIGGKADFSWAATAAAELFPGLTFRQTGNHDVVFAGSADRAYDGFVIIASEGPGVFSSSITPAAASSIEEGAHPSYSMVFVMKAVDRHIESVRSMSEIRLRRRLNRPGVWYFR
jgi:hypothetical protein